MLKNVNAVQENTFTPPNRRSNCFAFWVA